MAGNKGCKTNSCKGKRKTYRERGQLGSSYRSGKVGDGSSNTDFSNPMARRIVQKMSQSQGLTGADFGAGRGQLGSDEPPEIIDQYQAVKDPRYSALQQMYINRWKNTFKEGISEGRVGLNQEEQIGTGLRKTIKSLDKVLKYKSSGSTSLQRNTKVQRMIQSGNIRGALNRIAMSRFKKRPHMLTDVRKQSFDDELTGTQVGLMTDSKKNFKLAQKEKRMDNCQI